jgi:hypothetical protein
VDYKRENFDHRAAITNLRIEATKQVIVLAIALVAVPASIVGLGMQPNLGTAVSATYWTLNLLGMLAALVSAGGGSLFLLSAPNWAKDQSKREKILDCTYVLAPVSMFVSALFLTAGTFVAIISKIFCT